LGPEKGIVARIKNQYQFESLIKLEKSGNSQAVFKTQLATIFEELSARPEFRSVRFIVDVDPS
jgi:primosomal protein N' (replication factor Y)